MKIYRFFVLAFTVLFLSVMAPASSKAAIASLSRTSGPPTNVTVLTATGFAASDIYDIYFDLTQIAFKATNSRGAFTYNITIPASATPGPHLITVMRHFGAGASAQASFNVMTSWISWHGDAAERGWNQTENMLNFGTVPDLTLSWEPAKGTAVYTPVLVASDRIFFVDGLNHLVSYSRSTRARIFDVNAGAERITAPAFGNGLVVVAGETVSGQSLLKAFSATTGALVWKAVLPPGAGAPIIRDGVVYVVARGNVDAGLFAFSLNCATSGRTCRPLWRGPAGSTASYYYPENTLAISGGIIVANIGSTLYSFKVNCNTGGGTCAPTYSVANVDSMSPTIANGYVYVQLSDARLAAYKVTCIACGTAWTSGPLTNRSSRPPTFASNRVYVMDGSTLRVFPASCGARTCTELWSTTVEGTPYSATVAGNFVYVPTTKQVFAFPKNCYTGCPAYWHAYYGGVYSNVNYNAVTVVDGTVYVPDDDGVKMFVIGGNQAVANPAAKGVALSQLTPDPKFALAEEQLARRLRH